MVYLPPSQSIGNSPGPTPFPANGGSVLNSPMFQGYDTGASMPSYVTPPSAIQQAPVFNPTSITNPTSIPDVLTSAADNPSVQTAIESTAPRTGVMGALRGVLSQNWAKDAPAITGEEATGLLSKVPYAAIPLGLTIAGGMVGNGQNPNSQRYAIGQGLKTGGTASGLGLLGGAASGAALGSELPLPLIGTVGGALGGLGGGYINSRLAAHNVDFGPFHWGNSPHATAVLSNGNPTIDHLVGTALDQFQAGNISNSDFVTIMKNAQLQRALGGNDSKTDNAIATNLQNDIVQAAQLHQQNQAQQRQQVADNHRMLREQIAIAKLMQPQENAINTNAKGLADQIAAAHLSGPMAAWGQLLGAQTQQGARQQSAALTASTLALPQIQALMAQIQQANTLQQAANYYAAKQASGASGSSSLSSLLNQGATGATPVGASPTGG